MRKTKSYYKVGGTPYRITDQRAFQRFLDEQGEAVKFKTRVKKFIRDNPDKAIEVEEDGSPVGD